MRRPATGATIIAVLVMALIAGIVRCVTRPSVRQRGEYGQMQGKALQRYEVMLRQLGAKTLPTAGIQSCEDLAELIAWGPTCRDAASTAAYDGELTASIQVLAGGPDAAARCDAALSRLKAERTKLRCE